MNLLKLDLPPMSEVVAARRAHARRQAQLRVYQAAQLNRLTSDWTTAPTSGNYELRSSLRALRARARDMARNDPFLKRFFATTVSNVVGPKGVSLQVRARFDDSEGPAALDQAMSKKIEAAFAEWSHAENASASGRLSWLDAQRLFLRTVARDGEVLVRLIPARNPFGFALHFLDVNWLDESHNEVLPSGHRVLMGVEVDIYGRPVAYHLTPPYYDFYPAAYAPEHPRERVRVPAEEIIHEFVVTEGEEQTRGVPWTHAVIERLRHLGQYNLAEVVAARMAACKGGWLSPPDADETAGVPLDPDGEMQGAPQFDLEPGLLPVLPQGWKLNQFDLQHPNANYESFEKAMMRGVAAGLDTNYFSLTGDLSEVNYSTARVGLLAERDEWRGLQFWLIEHLHRRVYQKWLRAAMLAGALDLTVAQYERVKEAVWQPRGWAWVDPEKEINAHVTALENGLETRTDFYAERGEDFEDKIDQIALEQKYMKDKGIVLSGEKKSSPRPVKDDTQPLT